MCLRSYRTLPEMVGPKNTSLHQNNAKDIEQQVGSTTGHIETSTSVGENPIVISPMSTSTISLGVEVPLPQVSSVPTTYRVTQSLGDQRPHFPLNFLLPLGGREQPYRIPTVMMTDLHPTVSTYLDNMMAFVSPINPHLASRSAIRNHGRVA